MTTVQCQPVAVVTTTRAFAGHGSGGVHTYAILVLCLTVAFKATLLPGWLRACLMGLQVVFATAVTKPGHGNIAPLAIGFTLFASAFVGETHFLQPRHACRPALSRETTMTWC